MRKNKKATWREKCRAAIVPVIEANKGKSEREVRRALRAAWPFGPITPYVERIWLQETRFQLTKNNKPTFDIVTALFPPINESERGPYEQSR